MSGLERWPGTLFRTHKVRRVLFAVNTLYDKGRATVRDAVDLAEFSQTEPPPFCALRICCNHIFLCSQGRPVSYSLSFDLDNGEFPLRRIRAEVPTF